MSSNLKYLDRITEDDIKSAYDFNNFTHHCTAVSRDGLSTSVAPIEDVSGSDWFSHRVHYYVNITTRDGISILEDENLKIHRELYQNAKLRKPYCDSTSTRFGRVVKNLRLILTEQYCGQGIGFTICDMEEVLYRKWGAKEIQLNAVRSGRVVWKKRGFVLDCMHAGFVDTQYKFWCEKNNLEYLEKTDINDYPEEFLVSDLIVAFKMYKEM